MRPNKALISRNIAQTSQEDYLNSARLRCRTERCWVKYLRLASVTARVVRRPLSQLIEAPRGLSLSPGTSVLFLRSAMLLQSRAPAAPPVLLACN
jgi:hypothetical protein